MSFSWNLFVKATSNFVFCYVLLVEGRGDYTIGYCYEANRIGDVMIWVLGGSTIEFCIFTSSRLDREVNRKVLDSLVIEKLYDSVRQIKTKIELLTLFDYFFSIQVV
jgi:hypothetical protein